MKKLLILLLMAVGFLFVSCSESVSYSNIDDLYKASVEAMKSKDLKKIEEFVLKILPDGQTIRYMKDEKFSHRGFPEGLEEHPEVLSNAVVRLSNSLYQYALTLEMRGVLSDLRFIGVDDDSTPDSFKGEGFPNILFAEPYGLCVSSMSQDTIEFKLGELLRIDGKWKAFSGFESCVKINPF
ncbi:MAG: hypothetical protein LBG19_02955 [Prevotellaceae bacterium]|nr:hypothetical protein [Prevotellaceae bacterium]